jgi:hypothetical protein
MPIPSPSNALTSPLPTLCPAQLHLVLQMRKHLPPALARAHVLKFKIRAEHLLQIHRIQPRQQPVRPKPLQLCQRDENGQLLPWGHVRFDYGLCPSEHDGGEQLLRGGEEGERVRPL